MIGNPRRIWILDRIAYWFVTACYRFGCFVYGIMEWKQENTHRRNNH